MRKNRFFTFILSFMPGLGHMYLGFMKRGTSIMTVFLGIIFLAVSLDLGAICFILPVIWFYSFFDAINYNNMPIEQKLLVEDKIFLLDDILNESKYHSLIGGILVFLGIYMICNQFMSWYLLRTAFNLILSIIIILLGLTLIKNNRTKTTEKAEDLRKKEYTDFDEKSN